MSRNCVADILRGLFSRSSLISSIAADGKNKEKSGENEHIDDVERILKKTFASTTCYEAEGNSGEILATLELLMTEFFHPSTSNERKRDIEIMLESFASQDNSWRHCLYSVDKSSNQYVSMFALNTIENIILKKWNKVSSEGKLHIRRCLWTHLANNHRKIPPFLRNKAIKIIVDIVRREYLFSHSDFLLDLFDEIRKGGQSAVLGLLFIRNMTEGFDTQGRLHNDLSFCKRSTVERVVLHQMPRLIFILTDILKQLSDNQDIYLDLTPDPPPSPERCDGALETDYPQSALLPDLLASRTNPQRAGSYDGVGEECVILTLNILQNLFVWLPVSTHLQPSVITIVFHWASVATQKKFSEEVCVAGMSALNELMYRRASPPGSEFALRLGNGIGKLLDCITNPNGARTLANLSTEYIDKISDFLRMFVLKNLKQLEAEPEFDSMGFLALLFQFTFQVPKSSSFTLCLDIWSQFIDNLKKMDSLKYSDALAGLVNGVLKKIQYQHNNAELILLDNDLVNDDGETEWQTFLHHCIECMARAAETSPLHIFNLVLEVWQESVSAYSVGAVSLHHLKDLATLTQLLGRLMPTLFHDCDETTGKQCLAQADRFLENLLVVLQRVSATDHRLLQMQPKPMIDAFVRVHADVLACVGGVIPYVSQGSVQPAVLLRAAAPLLLPPAREVPQVASVLSHAAAHLLLSVAVSLRAPDPLHHLGDLVSRPLAHLEPKTAAVVRQALCVMVLQCPADGVQAPERIRQCSVLVDAWCAPLMSVAGPLAGGAATPVVAVRQACAQSLPPLGQLLDYFMDHNTQTKKMLAVVVERPVQAALMAFQNSNGDGEISTLVLELFLSLLGSLHQQLGNDFVQQSIRMFLDVAKRQEQGALQRLLQVLCLCVEGGALPGEAALAELLQLCVDHVLPTVRGADADPDVTHSLFQLFGSILIDRWQYFYSSCVRLGWSPAIAAAEAGADDGLRVQHSAHFRALLQAIIASFLSDHIDVFRLNLGTLEKLNSRWKLYQKMVFKREMLSPLLSVLLGALVRGGAARLLQEEVAAACYSLAAVDFSSYYSHFLPSFLASQPLPEPDVQELLKIAHSTDSPSFTYSFIAMVDDIRCLLGET